MATASRQKTFYCKRATIVGLDTATPPLLSSLILKAHQKEKRPLKRARREAEKVKLINQCYSRGPMVVGVMLDYTEGSFQPTVSLDEEGLELQIQLLEPREREQFVEGMLFFGVQGPNVIIVQSKSLRANEFQKYINWWLGEHTGVLEPGGFISLDNGISKETRKKLESVKSVVLKAPVTLANLRSQPETSPKQQTLTGLVKSQIWDLIRGTFSEKADADEAMEVEEIDLSLEIRRRGKMREGESLMDSIAQTLRDVETDVFELETSAGTIRGEELRLSTSMSVATLNGVPVLADVAEKMQKWMDVLIATEQIEAEED